MAMSSVTPGQSILDNKTLSDKCSQKQKPKIKVSGNAPLPK